MKAKKLIIPLVVTLPLIGLGVYATLPAKKMHVYLHQNWFERIGYNDENAEIELPFEVMMSDYEAINDSTLKVQLFCQPLGNRDPEKIETLVIEPLHTESYDNHSLYIEEYSYNEKMNKIQIFLKIEQLHYQLWLSKLGL